MKKVITWLLLGLAADCAVAVAVHGYWLPSGASQTLAAWVQACGSILAIGIAYLVGAKQSSAAIEAVTAAQNAVTASRKRGQFAVIEAARTFAEQIREAMRDEDPSIGLLAVYNKIVTQRLAQALERIPVHEVGSEAGVRAILSMANQFVLLEAALETYLAGPSRHPVIGKHLGQYAHDPRTQADIAKNGKAVLKKNVEVHLGRIAEDHEEVRAAMFPAEAIAS